MELYRRYAPALLRKARRLLGNPSDADDVVQAVFLELLTRGASVRGETTAIDLPYLFRAVTNRCLNLVRDQGNRQRLREGHALSAEAPLRSRCEDRVVDVDLLGKLVDRLDERSTGIFVYRYFDDLTQEEIAGLLSISRRTVYQRLEQIRALLVELAAGEGERR
jgi:RNA polymerase sigma-70 factor, ECF subfamily